jgi:hypothetical protein
LAPPPCSATPTARCTSGRCTSRRSGVTRRWALGLGLLLAALTLPAEAEASGFSLSHFPASLPAPILAGTKLGIGLYGAVPMSTLAAMRPSVILVQDPDPPSARALRAVFPQALIVGRLFVPDGDPSLASCQDATEPHEAKGEDFGQMVARRAVPLRGIVDAWVADNEQASSADPAGLACHAQFELGFVQRLQGRYGIAAVVGNDASGAVSPQDYATFFAQPISQAMYLGLHAYGKPGAASLQTSDSQYYALRYRQVHDALLRAGVPLPRGGFLLTETGLFDGWRGQASDRSMAGDYLWLEQQIEQDGYVRGQMAFGLGVGPQYQRYELGDSAIPAAFGDFAAARAPAA